MTALVTKTDLDNYKYIADSVKNSAVWPQFVIEAQSFDVKYWLGDGLLNEICEQEAGSPQELSTANSTLLNGGSYVYLTKTYLFSGLKAVIIYYAFARFINWQQVNITQAGITIKDTDFSTPASAKDIQRMATEAKLTADAMREELELFLSRNSTTYPLYSCGTNVKRIRTIYAVGD